MIGRIVGAAVLFAGGGLGFDRARRPYGVFPAVAYDRGELLRKRLLLMEQWGDFAAPASCDRPVSSSPDGERLLENGGSTVGVGPLTDGRASAQPSIDSGAQSGSPAAGVSEALLRLFFDA